MRTFKLVSIETSTNFLDTALVQTKIYNQILNFSIAHSKISNTLRFYMVLSFPVDLEHLLLKEIEIPLTVELVVNFV